MKKKSLRKVSRLRAKSRIKKRIRGSEERPRLCVFKSSKYTYAQIISDIEGKTLAAASTHDKDVLDQVAGIAIEGRTAKSAKSAVAAKALGIVLAKRAKEKKVSKVVFDRGGYVYSGRVQAVAEGAREGGLDF